MLGLSADFGRLGGRFSNWLGHLSFCAEQSTQPPQTRWNLLAGGEAKHMADETLETPRCRASPLTPLAALSQCSQRAGAGWPPRQRGIQTWADRPSWPSAECRARLAVPDCTFPVPCQRALPALKPAAQMKPRFYSSMTNRTCATSCRLICCHEGMEVTAVGQGYRPRSHFRRAL